MEKIKVHPVLCPVLDADFLPAVLWNQKYLALAKNIGEPQDTGIALERPNGNRSVLKTKIIAQEKGLEKITLKYIERLLKCLLWMKGGNKITIAAPENFVKEIRKIYSRCGRRAFDSKIIGEKIYGRPLKFYSCSFNELPTEKESGILLGKNLNGCRIGFDLGGSDRKCAALIDGKVIFSEEIKWEPYFQKNPSYHKNGINDLLKRAASKLPKVDAIGGSAAGVYVDNTIRVSSLFRGISEGDFKKYVKNMFLDIKKEWGNIPFVVVNDGEVTALAGAMEIKDNAVLGISMGTSMAAGYVTPEGSITDWLNELAFVPIDYRDLAPVDEWSKDIGCGVQYFSQQAVARLAKKAKISFNKKLTPAERLVEIQKLIKKEDERALKIYESIGVYLGYGIAHYACFYDFKNFLVLGRVTSGEGGDIILANAKKVLKTEFPELFNKIKFKMPDEKNKRHGQAIAAASLPKIS
ncbi:transcriptional regulator [bacterium Unc6]|nr:transcriptional regulator [bacterium Unc6]